MADTDTVVFVFSLDERLFGLPVSALRQVLPATDITPIFGAPGDILGMIDFHGEILPVIDMRAKCAFPPRETSPGDRFVILDAHARTLALRVDDTRDVLGVPAADIVPPEDVVGALPGLRGIFRHAEGLVPLYDPEVMFAPECEMISALNRAAPV